MNLTTITMDAETAAAMYEEYRALGTRTTEDDEAIMAGLREIKRGRPLIDLDVAIPAGGCDKLGRPRLAVSRADQLEVQATRRSAYVDGKWVTGMGELRVFPSDRGSWESLAGSLDFRWDADIIEWDQPMTRTWFSLVPPVPPRFRPRGALSRYAILWEAEWSSVSKHAPAPKDPALLRRITGSLYAVLAVWDLTDLERLVLGMTRR